MINDKNERWRFRYNIVTLSLLGGGEEFILLTKKNIPAHGYIVSHVQRPDRERMLDPLTWCADILSRVQLRLIIGYHPM
jgi:hypothetical protein